MVRRIAGILAPILLLAVALPAPVGASPDVPNPDRIHELRREARQVGQQLAEARARLDAAVRAYESGRTDLERVARRLAEAEARSEQVRQQLEEARRILERRAVAVYKYGGQVNLVQALLTADSFGELLRSARLAGAVLNHDNGVVRTVEELQARAEVARAAVEEEKASRQAQVGALQARQDELMASMRQVGALQERIQSDLGSELGKFRFPVRAPYSYVDTFGAPRPGWRSHQGTDIFAPRGTALVAVVGGTLENVGWNNLGGNRLWIRAPDGHSYYYAHLSSFAPGMRDGRRVEPGEVVGYVGDTGNAVGTPPHLHFEIHRPGGGAINPYPVLRRAENAWAHL